MYIVRHFVFMSFILKYKVTLLFYSLCQFIYSGHCAKFGSYTMMNLETNRVVDIQLVQVSLNFVSKFVIH